MRRGANLIRRAAVAGAGAAGAAAWAVAATPTWCDEAEAAEPAAAAAAAVDTDWHTRPKAEHRCDMEQLTADFRVLYGCQSMAKPETIERLYGRRAKLEDPAMTLRSRDSIRSAFDGMAVLFDKAAVNSVDVMPRDGTFQDPDLLVVWVDAEYEVFGRAVPFRTASRLTFAPGECVVQRHEDLWSGKEFARRETVGFLGNFFDFLRDANGIVSSAVFRVMAWAERSRRERSGKPAPFASGNGRPDADEGA